MTLQSRQPVPVLDRRITVHVQQASGTSSWAGNVYTETNISVWAGLISPGVADSLNTGDGKFTLWQGRIYVIRYRKDVRIDAETYMTDEQGNRRKITGSQEWGGRRRYIALATEGSGQ